MKSTTRYICEICEKEFVCVKDAQRCEGSHVNGRVDDFNVVEIVDGAPHPGSHNRYPKSIRVYKKGANRGVTGGPVYKYEGVR